ncbi:flagellar hook-associated protein 3 FlgL [Paenibacillus sophorae]|uniref:Flagellar hook-associated protein 3 FlgL n=1 Tax=Paenibacillus sophorae TaxID=1333845 RepID=A0A1H8I7V2_9BACL|nr:flagellar hook-associated protein FlgL [Paenibacillus sophorae]QWU15871.1 flagellar hook-associated protein FlgL [Paenibacillus sophorae]SEN64287.1 flagellar hook-associated protein 3 FlgL [Paenibacillus sophorae]
MLRVTSNMMNSQLLLNLNRNARTMNDTQLQLSSGRKINKPSDDPVGITYSLRYRAELSSNEQYTKNVDSALSWLDYNDTVLGQAGDVVQRLRELTVQASTGSNPQSALDSINQEVMQLKEQLVDISNSKLNGKYIFNGEQYNTKPYDFAKGSDGTYDVSKNITTDTGQIQYIVGEGVQMPINMTGNDVFGHTGDADNIFTIINNISSSLTSGDLVGVSSQLDKIDTRVETILSSRAEIGAKTNRVELIRDRLSDLNINLTDLQAKTEDADYEGLIMQSKIQENIYNASLSVGAKIISTSLVDFIR